MKTMVFVGNSEAGGLSVYGLNREDGTLAETGRYLADAGVAPLAVSPDRRFVYAAVRTADPMRVAAFAVDGAAGTLHSLNDAPVPVAPTYMTVDRGGRFLLIASYGGDLLWSMALGREGMVQTEPAQVLRAGRNPHAVVLDAANRFGYVPLLGSDRIAQYGFDAALGTLTPLTTPFVPTPREAGPRHLVFHPDGRHAYVLEEMGGNVMAYSVDRETGKFTPTHGAPLLSPDRALPPGRYEPPRNSSGGANSPSPVMWAADIHITPDGRFLYASERTRSTLSRFGIDPVSGRLDLLDVMDTEEQPRSFAVDPFGRFLVVAGEKSNCVSIYRIGEADGALAIASRMETGQTPNWVEIIVA